MGKNAKKIVNKIEELNIEIDYEKLANSMVEAQLKANAKGNEIDGMGGAIKTIMVTTFLVICVVLLLTGGYYMIAIINGTEEQTFKNGFAVIVCFVYGGASGFLCYAANKIRDKIYLMSCFNAIIALTALIVTLVK